MRHNVTFSSASTNSCSFPTLPNEYAYKCFPVRKFNGLSPTTGGAWLVEYKNEKIKQFNHTKSGRKVLVSRNEARNRKELTGYYLVRHSHCDDPSDICNLNISSEDLHTSQHEDFDLFTNVASIEASDNHLHLETFRTFPHLEKLDLQLNNITCLHISSHKQFNALHNLDLSYNNLTETSLLELGKLRNLKTLHVRACGFKFLPPDMARGYLINPSDSDETKEKSKKKTRYPSLKSLDLSENKLTDISTFASLAGLRRLEVVNLSNNFISCVPHLRLMVAQRHFSASTCAAEPAVDTTNPTAVSKSHDESIVDAQGNEKKTNTVQKDVDEAADENNPSVVSETETNHIIPESTQAKDSTRIDDQAIDKVTLENAQIQDTNVENNTNAKSANNEILNNLDEVLNDLSSEVRVEETNELLNMKFGQELHFSLTAHNLPPDDLNLKTSSGETFEEQLDEDFLDAEDDISDDIKRPFDSLMSLDLSCNQVADEESLLALTSWPALQELKIWGNPLVKSYNGVPPVIHHHLQRMCGVSIIRKKPVVVSKRHFNLPKANVRCVKTDLPPIKRNNLLMIEAAIQRAIEGRDSNGEKNADDSRIDADDSPVEEAVKPQTQENENDDQTFFITQVDEVCVEDLPTDHYDKRVFEDDEIAEEKQIALNLESILQIDDDIPDDMELPETIQGSVFALKHLLQHPLVFNTGEYANNYQSSDGKQKTKVPKKRRVAKQLDASTSDPLNTALQQIKLQENTYEDNLAHVLNEYSRSKDIRKKFPEVKKMVKRVQRKYNEVRLESLRPIIRTQNELSQLATRADKPSQELVLSRMKQQRIGDMYSSSRGSTPRSRLRERSSVKAIH